MDDPFSHQFQYQDPPYHQGQFLNQQNYMQYPVQGAFNQPPMLMQPDFSVPPPSFQPQPYYSSEQEWYAPQPQPEINYFSQQAFGPPAQGTLRGSGKRSNHRGKSMVNQDYYYTPQRRQYNSDNRRQGMKNNVQMPNNDQAHEPDPMLESGDCNSRGKRRNVRGQGFRGRGWYWDDYNGHQNTGAAVGRPPSEFRRARNPRGQGSNKEEPMRNKTNTDRYNKPSDKRVKDSRITDDQRQTDKQQQQQAQQPNEQEQQPQNETPSARGSRLLEKIAKNESKNEPGASFMRKSDLQKGKLRNFPRKGYMGKDDETQRGTLIEQLSSNTYECMICCEVVKREASIWNCGNCFHFFHLRCIKRWASSSTATEEDSGNGWRCPACQNLSTKFPRQYRCFCGRQRDPEYNRYDTPHSCGEVCQKKRSNDCPHPCNILCHPGPCPPCQATVNRHCDCGKSKQTVKCGQSTTLKCKETCGKQLNCGRHLCGQVCHPGPCQPCDVTVKQLCYCENNSREVVCGSSGSFKSHYSCEQACKQELECGNHHCTAKCHPRPCEPCKLLPSAVTHCPCKKVPLTELLAPDKQRGSCTDPVPVCDNICDKPLHCGSPEKTHRCQQKCHMGECGPCEGTSVITCRCTGCTKEIACTEARLFSAENPYKCDRRCNKKKQCGRHKCKQQCCVEKEHHCNKVCGQKLTCGLHRCEEPCHRGNCPPCWQVSFEELHCLCGAEIIFPPVPCGTQPPECHNPCTRQHSCNHPVRHNCHNEETCPPCTELTEKWCMGKHEKRKNIPCHLKDISCGLPCKRDLPCGLHKCQLICHKNECDVYGDACTQLCPRIREQCGHPCNNVCHGDMPCPKTACQTEIVITCKCGSRSERVLCLSGVEKVEDYQKMATMMMAMKMADVQSGQSIDISSLTSDPSKKRTRELECNSDCALKERNRRLALALEIKNPDMRSKLHVPPYTEFLKSYAKQNATFVAGIEKILFDLVESAQKSKTNQRSYAFPSMNREQRRTIHELAEFYGCETQSYDQEPMKNVVARAVKDKVWHPKISLTSLMQRELHPRAPVPIPLGSKEKDIRSSVAASKQGTRVLSSGTSWSSIAGTAATPPKASSTDNWTSKFKVTSSTTVLKNLKKEEPVIDYFDMTG